MSMEEPREFEKYKKTEAVGGRNHLISQEETENTFIIYSVANEQYYCNLVYSTGF